MIFNLKHLGTWAIALVLTITAFSMTQTVSANSNEGASLSSFSENWLLGIGTVDPDMNLDLQHPRTKTYGNLARGNYTIKNNGPDDVEVSVGDGESVIVEAGGSLTVGVPRGGSVTLALTEEGEGASGTFTKD